MFGYHPALCVGQLMIMKAFVQRLVRHAYFERFIIGAIIIGAVLVGIEAQPALSAEATNRINLGHQLILLIFIAEAVLKIYAVAPHWRNYFGNGWNVFDFSIVVLALLPMTGSLATVGRLLRLLRVMRLLTVLPELRLIVATLIRSIPSMANVVVLMMILFYIYGVAGFHLFHQHDPTHWGSLGLSLLTLFRIITLEDWTDVMYTAMEFHPMAWIYFVSFVIFGTFVVINLFIAVVINNLEESKQERLRELQQPPTHNELIDALDGTRRMLERLQTQLDSSSSSRATTTTKD